jgi:hypothetical protein
MSQVIIEQDMIDPIGALDASARGIRNHYCAVKEFVQDAIAHGATCVRVYTAYKENYIVVSSDTNGIGTTRDEIANQFVFGKPSIGIYSRNGQGCLSAGHYLNDFDLDMQVLSKSMYGNGANFNMQINKSVLRDNRMAIENELSEPHLKLCSDFHLNGHGVVFIVRKKKRIDKEELKLHLGKWLGERLMDDPPCVVLIDNEVVSPRDILSKKDADGNLNRTSINLLPTEKYPIEIADEHPIQIEYRLILRQKNEGGIYLCVDGRLCAINWAPDIVDDPAVLQRDVTKYIRSTTKYKAQKVYPFRSSQRPESTNLYLVIHASAKSEGYLFTTPAYSEGAKLKADVLTKILNRPHIINPWLICKDKNKLLTHDSSKELLQYHHINDPEEFNNPGELELKNDNFVNGVACEKEVYAFLEGNDIAIRQHEPMIYCSQRKSDGLVITAVKNQQALQSHGFKLDADNTFSHYLEVKTQNVPGSAKDKIPQVIEQHKSSMSACKNHIVVLCNDLVSEASRYQDIAQNTARKTRDKVSAAYKSNTVVVMTQSEYENFITEITS